MLTTGGTISAARRADGALAPGVDTDDLLATIPREIGARVRIETRAIMSIDSAAMDPRHLTRLARTVRGAADHADAADDPGGPDGIVVLHGTDTMEESALLTDLTLESAGCNAVPVVFTGAQRSADHPQPDGPANLALAIGAAGADPRAASPPRTGGVTIAFHGKILPAWGTRKTETAGLDGFTPWPDHGAARRSRESSLAALRSLGAPRDDRPLPRVDTVALYPGADATALEAFRAAGARGIVVEALGAGNTNPAVVEAVRRTVRAGIPVVVSTRVPNGPVFADYGGGGGGADLHRAGAALSPVLRAGQARVLLAVLLAAGAGPREVSRAFAG